MKQPWPRPTLYQAALVFTLCTAALMAGCSGSAPTGSVTGKVTYKGSPVEGGTLTFVPESTEGKGVPGSATVAADGTYTVGSYGKNDGAVIGKHKISYSPVMDTKTLKPGEKHTSPYDGLVCKPDSVEVKAGSNKVEIELVPKGK